jgi:hypothetical protein
MAIARRRGSADTSGVAGSHPTRGRCSDRAHDRDPEAGDREGSKAEAEALMFRIRRFSEHDVTLESVR